MTLRGIDMFRKLKEDIAYIGLSIKKEIIIFSTINVLMITAVVLAIIFKVTNFMIFIYASFMPLVDYLYLSRYRTMVHKIELNHNNEFISLLSYFEIFISHHHNVYKSLEMLIPYSSDWMNSKLTKLLDEIDLDKSVTPYIKFAKNFTYLVIENVMVSIYQMVEEGGSKANLEHFDFVFSSLNSTLMTSKIENHKRNIESLNAFPLIGAGLITITLTLSIISLLGELTYVI